MNQAAAGRFAQPAGHLRRRVAARRLAAVPAPRLGGTL